MSECEHPRWVIEDFALLAMPHGQFLHPPTIERCAEECGATRKVDIPPEAYEEQRLAWERYEAQRR